MHPLQKLVKRRVKKMQLHLCYKHLPEGVSTVGFFFIRTSCEAIPVPSSPGEANSLLPRCFETGTVNNKPLNALERVLTHVYIPMLMVAGECHAISTSIHIHSQVYVTSITKQK